VAKLTTPRPRPTQRRGDEASNTAVYNYDAVGNLLGINRFTPGASGIGVYAVLLGKGAVGVQVKSQGYGVQRHEYERCVIGDLMQSFPLTNVVMFGVYLIQPRLYPFR